MQDFKLQLQIQELLRQGFTFHSQNRFDEAQKFYDQILNLQPNHFNALQLSATLAAQLKNFQQAIELFDKSLEINNNSELYNNRGNVLRALKRFEEALASYEKAISLKPYYAEAHYNLGIVLYELNRFDEALASYEKALSLKPNYPEAYYNRGNLLKQLNRLDEALADYEKVVQIAPEYKYVYGNILHLKLFMCDWSNLYDHVAKISEKISFNREVSHPFITLSLLDNPFIQYKCAQIYSKEKHPANCILGPITKREKRQRIRIGYFSADFCNHAVSFLTAELFEIHNRDHFEVIGFSFGSAKPDSMTDRLSRAFDQFVDVRNLSDLAVANLSREMGIDIAVDLGGYTKDSRTDIFSYRAAPIQISYIGYLGAMGAEYFDYLIADWTIIPERFRAFYSEKIIYLPSYQVNDRKRTISEKRFTRKELGLPETGFVYCCFNNIYKILPATFDSWMRILNAVEGSVLFLNVDNKWAEVNLKNEAKARGINPHRLIFAKRIPQQEYLSRFHVCDLFLDTLPYNAGTTASDALWAGLPVLTLAGKSFPSRVAASLLTALDLPDLITQTQSEYESLAIELARNPSKLSNIKLQKLANNRLTMPLFDTPLFARNIENAFTQAMERYIAGLTPNDIFIDT